MKKSFRKDVSYAIGFFISIALAAIPLAVSADDTMSSICPGGRLPTSFDYNGVISTVLKPVDAASSDLFTGAGAFASTLFKLLGTIELVWFIAHTLFFKREIHDLLHGAAFKIVSLMFLMAVIVGFSQGGGTFVKTLVFTDFANIGQNIGEKFPNTSGSAATGVTTTSASAEAAPVSNILYEGDCATYAIISYPAEKWNSGVFGGSFGFLNPVNLALNTAEIITSIPGIILGFVVAAIVGLTYVYLAGLMLVAIIDGLITLAVGMLLLGFAGSRWTSAMADNYTKLIFHTGFKVLAINIVAGLGVGMIGSALDTAMASAYAPGKPLSGPSLPFSSLISLLIIAAIVALLAKNVNGIANTLAGSPSINLAGSAANAAIGAAVVGAAAVTGGVAGAGALMSRSAAGGAMTNGAASAALKNTITDGAAGAAPPTPVLGSGAPGIAGAPAAAPTAAPIGAPANGTSLPLSAPIRAAGNGTPAQTAPSGSPAQTGQPASPGSAPRSMPEYAINAIDDEAEEGENVGAPTPAVAPEMAVASAAALSSRNQAPIAPKATRSSSVTTDSGQGAPAAISSRVGSGTTSSGSAGNNDDTNVNERDTRPPRGSSAAFVEKEAVGDLIDDTEAVSTDALQRQVRSSRNRNGQGQPVNTPRAGRTAGDSGNTSQNQNPNGNAPGSSAGSGSGSGPRVAEAAATAAAASEAVYRATAPAAPNAARTSDPIAQEDDADQPLRDRDLTPAAKDARIKRLRSLTDTIKNAVAQHHNHTAVPPGPSIRH